MPDTITDDSSTLGPENGSEGTEADPEDESVGGPEAVPDGASEVENSISKFLLYFLFPVILKLIFSYYMGMSLIICLHFQDVLKCKKNQKLTCQYHV